MSEGGGGEGDELEAERRSAGSPAERSAQGRFIAGYAILGVLGEGGTGVVYDARDPRGEPVALKVMHAELAGDAQIRGRFQREAAILRRLAGPHICPIIELGEVGSGEAQGALYIALEKIDGVSLEKKLLLDRGKMPVARVLDVMLEVCAALQTAHAQGVIHRDLKPANVILRGEADVVVVDFGMSKIVTGGTGTTQLTVHNMLFGTPEYMSPEQARGEELDARCDVYAAGVMLYEMLTGAPPFVAATPLAVLTEHLTGEIVPPRAKAEERVSPALEAVVLHALAREPADRYIGAEALAEGIRRARASADDVVAASPSAVSAAIEISAPEALAATQPAFDALPRSSAGASVTPEAFAQTVRADPGPSVPPTSGVDRREPVRLAASSRPPRAEARRSARPRPSLRVKVPSEPMSRTWIFVWVVAGIVSVAVGVWFALRGP